MAATTTTNNQLQLFPLLPPELRNRIYHFTTTESNLPTSTGLPFSTKTYITNHTTLTLTPLHTGSPSLLSLTNANVLEAREYTAYLLAHATKLHITLTFKGHANTFVQKDWDKKVSAQLAKLVRNHGWVGLVKEINVDVLWRPKVESLKRVKKGDVGEILRGVVKTVLGIREQKLWEMGRVRVCVRVDAGTVRAGRCWGLDLGIEKVLCGGEDGPREVREVWVDVEGEGREVGVGKGLVRVGNVEREFKRYLALRRVVEGKEDWFEGLGEEGCKEQMWVRDEVLGGLEREGAVVGELKIVED